MMLPPFPPFPVQNRCVRCQFEFDKDDPIVVFEPARVGETLLYLGEYTKTGDYLEMRDHNPPIIIAFCRHFKADHDLDSSEPPRRVPKAVCVHKLCHSIVPSGHGTRPFSFIQATHFAFPPSSREEKRRTVYIQSELAKKLQHSSIRSPRLPQELWTMVTQHLVKECAAITAQERLRGRDTIPADTIVDLSGSKPVCASYVKIDGKAYIKSLQHGKLRSPGVFTHLLLRPHKRGKGNASKIEELDLFLAHDHLGIRQIFLVLPEDLDKWHRRRPDIPDVWWRHLSIRAPMVSSITTKSDAFKLQDVLPITCTPRNELETYPLQLSPSTYSFLASWKTLPRSPLVSREISSFRPNQSVPKPHHAGMLMHSFDCNSPDIIGYWGLFDYRNILAVFAHKRGEQVDKTLYQDAEAAAYCPERCHWVYIPIDEGEFITEIYHRRGHGNDIKNKIHRYLVGAMFCTNKGRTVEIGAHDLERLPYMHVRLGRYWLKRFAKLEPGRPCRIFYNRCDKDRTRYGFQVFAFEEGTVILPEILENHLYPLPSMVPGMSEYLRSLNIEPNPPDLVRYGPPLTDAPAIAGSRYSACSMANVAEISMSLKRSDDHGGRDIVTGLLVRYRDDHRESIGSFRPDRTTGPVYVHLHDTIYLSRGQDGEKMWINGVTTEEPRSEEEKTNCLAIFQTGTLAWCALDGRDVVAWFRDVVTYNGKVDQPWLL